jgi:hypothetical protein
MTKLQEAIKIVEEVEQDELSAPVGGDVAVDVPPPSEPPVSDDAVGADTEGNIALQLLTDIKDLLSELVSLEGDEAAEEGEPDLGDEERPVDALPMPDEDEGGEEDEEDEEDFVPGKTTSPEN